MRPTKSLERTASGKPSFGLVLPLNSALGRAKEKTLEYTDQQLAAFKDAYAKRLRKQLIMIVLLFAVMAALAFTEEGDTFFGLSQAVFGSISLVVIVVGWVIFNGRNWRCPACHKYLGRAFNPKHCHRCGIELRG